MNDGVPEENVPKEQRGAWRFLAALNHRISQLELRVLLVLAGLLVGTWCFYSLADLVVAEELHPLDERLLLLMRTPSDLSDPIGPAWLEEFMRDVTALGSTGVLLFITAGVVGYLAIRRNYRTMLLVILAVTGAFLLTWLLKEIFSRARPDLIAPITPTFNPSFPSGHSMISAAVYLTLGTLVARVQARRYLKVYVMALAAILTLAVGVTRVYLGVHWPSDVLAGWTAGVVWALFVWLVARRLLT